MDLYFEYIKATGNRERQESLVRMMVKQWGDGERATLPQEVHNHIALNLYRELIGGSGIDLDGRDLKREGVRYCLWCDAKLIKDKRSRTTVADAFDVRPKKVSEWLKKFSDSLPDPKKEYDQRMQVWMGEPPTDPEYLPEGEVTFYMESAGRAYRARKVGKK